MCGGTFTLQGINNHMIDQNSLPGIRGDFGRSGNHKKLLIYLRVVE